MNAKLWVCVFVGVLVAHLAVLFIIVNVRTLRNQQPQTKIVEPTFFTSTTTFTDAQGQKVKEFSEYTVSTELAGEAALKKLPPPPSGAR